MLYPVSSMALHQASGMLKQNSIFRIMIADIKKKGGGASLVAQMIKNPPIMWETWVQFLDWENPLEEGMSTHSSILAWRIPTDRGAWWATVHGVAKSQTRLS